MDDDSATAVAALTVGRGWALYVGPVETGHIHRHHAAQLAWSGEEPLSVAGTWSVLKAPGHLVPADVPHQLVAARAVRILFLDPTVLEQEPENAAEEPVELTPLQVDVLEDELMRWRQEPSSEASTGIAVRASSDPRWRLTLECSIRHWTVLPGAKRRRGRWVCLHLVSCIGSHSPRLCR